MLVEQSFFYNFDVPSTYMRGTKNDDLYHYDKKNVYSQLPLQFSIIIVGIIILTL